MIYNYLYKITNKINGKIYIGVHSTKNLNDGYFGSGKILKQAIEKYGIENFQKEILEFFETKEKMYEKEKEIVNEEFIRREDTYNIKIGGNGGFDYINENKLNRPKKENYDIWKKKCKRALKIGSEKHSYLLKTNENYRKNYSQKMSNTQKERFRKNPGTFTGRKHSEESKQKLKNTLKKINHQKGEKNSQYGTCWIYNLEIKGNKKIKINDLEKYINLGWKKGRKIKF